MTFDPHHFKSQFPLFAQLENQALVYLDNAATTQKPAGVIEAITHFYCSANGNAQRGSHRLGRAATAMIERVRAQAVDFLGAECVDEVVFTSGTTASINMLAHGLVDACRGADHRHNVVLGYAEHHANWVPWQRLVDTAECELRFLPSPEASANSLSWQSVVDEHTRVLALSAASNVLGRIEDLSVLQAIKSAYPDIIIVLDASQLAGHRPLQASVWACDFLVCSPHKFYGPTGVGLLYGRRDALAALSPWVLGGEMVDKVEQHKSTYRDGVQRFEAGTSSMAAIAGLGACFEFWSAQDRTAISRYETALCEYLHEQLHQRLGHYLTTISHKDNNVGIATVVMNKEGSVGASYSGVLNDSFNRGSLADIAHYLDEHDIAVRVGDHCAQPLWQSLHRVYGEDKGLRIALSAYNTQHDIDRLLTVMEAYFTQAAAERPLAAEDEEWSDTDWPVLLEAKSWQTRYKLLLRWGQRIQAKPEIRQPQFLVKGCESTVWLRCEPSNSRYHFFMDSDSNVIKGLSALLLMWFDGKTANEIAAVDVKDRCQQLGLEKHLSPSRNNGFLALLDAMLKSVAIRE